MTVMRILSISICITPIFFFFPHVSRAEKIHCKDGTLLTGKIIHASKEFLWLQDGKGYRGIGLKTVESIENDDGSPSPFDYKSTIRKIQEYFTQKNYLEAKKLCDGLLQNFPDNSNARYLRAILNQKTGDITQAISDYTFLIDNGLADAKVFNNAGSIYAKTRDFNKAIPLFEKAISLNPGIAEAHNNLADLLMQKNDYMNAAEEYKKVIQLEPDNYKILFNLGLAYAKTGDYAQAKNLWSKLLSLNPGDTETQQALAEIQGI